MATNVTVNAATPWKKYFCNASTPCPVAGTTCHYNTYCIPTSYGAKATCKDPEDTVAPFVARIDNIYTLFCDMPDTVKPQTTKCPLGCESYEDCHADICFVKSCNAAQIACKNGNDEQCLGVSREETFCYNSNPHGNTIAKVEEKGLSSSQVGGIAGGVSAAVIVLAAVGAFFFVRRRRANKAKAAKAQTLQSALPTYSAQDEKNHLSQVTTSA